MQVKIAQCVARVSFAADGRNARRVRGVRGRHRVSRTASSAGGESHRPADDRQRRRPATGAIICGTRCSLPKAWSASPKRSPTMSSRSARRPVCSAWAGAVCRKLEAAWLPSLREGQDDWQVIAAASASTMSAAGRSIGAVGIGRGSAAGVVAQLSVPARGIGSRSIRRGGAGSRAMARGRGSCRGRKGGPSAVGDTAIDGVE